MRLNSGDHLCAMYSSPEELAGIAVPFLSDGLRRGERCWYLPNGKHDADAVRSGLKHRNVDPRAESKRGALAIVASDAAYAIRGEFDPEQTMRVFSAAIEKALNDGFSGFRAAAEMSWVLGCTDGAECLIRYEALLRSLFSSARATGLCFYHRDRMPLQVIDGALATHPIVAVPNAYIRNPHYDQRVVSLPKTDAPTVRRKLAALDTHC